MMTSKLFLGAWLAAGLMIATSMWEGNDVAMTLNDVAMTLTAAAVGGALVGWFVQFMWKKILEYRRTH